MPIGPEFWGTLRNVFLSFLTKEACRHVIYSYMVLTIWTWLPSSDICTCTSYIFTRTCDAKVYNPMQYGEKYFA